MINDRFIPECHLHLTRFSLFCNDETDVIVENRSKCAVVIVVVVAAAVVVVLILYTMAVLWASLRDHVSCAIDV